MNRVVGACVAGLLACAGSTTAGTNPALDAGQPAHEASMPVDAKHDAVRRDASTGRADTGGLHDAEAGSIDVAADAPRPLASCEAVSPPPAIGCPGTLPVDFMCAITQAAQLTSLGCTGTDVVGSGELLACCPTCPGTDAGACYQ